MDLQVKLTRDNGYTQHASPLQSSRRGAGKRCTSRLGTPIPPRLTKLDSTFTQCESLSQVRVLRTQANRLGLQEEDCARFESMSKSEASDASSSVR